MTPGARVADRRAGPAAPRWFAFLRAINVGGHTVTSDRLRALFVELGLADVESFIASGNLTFRAPGRGTLAGRAAALEAKIAAHLRAALGYEVVTFLRTPAELARAATFPPFTAAEQAKATTLNVGFLAEKPSAAICKAILACASPVDTFRVDAREVYWHGLTKQSESPFFKVPFERRIGAAVTWRGVNTLRRFLGKYPAD